MKLLILVTVFVCGFSMGIGLAPPAPEFGPPCYCGFPEDGSHPKCSCNDVFKWESSSCDCDADAADRDRATCQCRVQPRLRLLPCLSEPSGLPGGHGSPGSQDVVVGPPGLATGTAPCRSGPPGPPSPPAPGCTCTVV